MGTKNEPKKHKSCEFHLQQQKSMRKLLPQNQTTVCLFLSLKQKIRFNNTKNFFNFGKVFVVQ